MMPSLSPALDTATTTPTPINGSAAEESSNPFATLIQGLSSVADAALPVAVSPQPAQPQPLPAGSDPLTSALATVLQALGLSESLFEPALATEGELSGDTAAGTDPSNGASTNASAADNTATLQLSVPLLPPNPIIMPATIAPASGAGRPANFAPALTTAASSPAQLQARQWLAALAPAQAANDSTNSELPNAAAQQTLTQQLPVMPTSTPIAFTSAMPPGNAWLQQSSASLFGMSSGTESSPVSADLGVLTSSPNLPTDTPKGMPTSLSFTQTLSSTSGNTTAPVLTTLLPHAVQDPAWSDAFGQRVAMLAQQGTQTATLQLNPPELGPIQVRIALSEQGAKVEFNTSQQTTSDLIETAMPRLAAALEHQGLRLDDSRVNLVSNRQDVFSTSTTFASARQDTPQDDRGQTAQQQAQHAAHLASADAEAEAGLLAGNIIRLPSAQDSGIDYYA